jgi:hypothetical protein
MSLHSLLLRYPRKSMPSDCGAGGTRDGTNSFDASICSAVRPCGTHELMIIPQLRTHIWIYMQERETKGEIERHSFILQQHTSVPPYEESHRVHIGGLRRPAVLRKGAHSPAT